MQKIIYIGISLVISIAYFQFLDWFLMDMQGLDYFYILRYWKPPLPVLPHVVFSYIYSITSLNISISYSSVCRTIESKIKIYRSSFKITPVQN